MEASTAHHNQKKVCGDMTSDVTEIKKKKRKINFEKCQGDDYEQL